MLTLILSVSASYAFIDSYTIDREKLPEEAQQMLQDNFPNAKISMIKIDRHLLKKSDYVVKLTNGAKIEFSNKGKWKSVDCGKKTVPESLVPNKIRTYVVKNHPDVSVTGIRKTSSNYEVSLSDGVCLKFNLLYQFKGFIKQSETADDEPE